MEATSTLHIDLDAIAHNVDVLRQCCAPCVRFCAVLKSDGYGLGAREVAPALARAGASMFAVFSLAEAEALIDLPVPIIVLMPVRTHQFSEHLRQALHQGRLHLVLHEAGQLADLEQVGRQMGIRIPVHLKIDTGLHRGGCDPRDAVVLARAAGRCQGLDLCGVMTHFAQAASNEVATATQMRQLNSVIASLRGELSPRTIVHASGTCGLLRGEPYHADMVRIGLGWTGHLTPKAEPLRAMLPQPLRPAVSWRSRLVLIRTIAVGERVGYGGSWQATRPTRVGVIPVGYGDGYPLDAARPADGGPGLAVGVGSGRQRGGDQQWAPIIGSVNMDQIVVDLTEVSEAISVGDPVQLISSDRASACGLEAHARRLGRPPHALLVQIQSTVPRAHLVRSKLAPAMMPATAAG